MSDAATRSSLVDRMAAAMLDEIEHEVNVEKGGWTEIGPDQHDEETVYHVMKLVLAHRVGDLRAVKEHAADVANCAGMLADAAGALDLSVDPRPEYDATGGVWLKAHARHVLDGLEAAIAPDPWPPPVEVATIVGVT